MFIWKMQKCTAHLLSQSKTIFNNSNFFNDSQVGPGRPRRQLDTQVLLCEVLVPNGAKKPALRRLQPNGHL